MHAPLVPVEKEWCWCSVHGVREAFEFHQLMRPSWCCGPTRVLDHIIRHARGAGEIMDLSYSSAYVGICTYIFLAVSEIQFRRFEVRSVDEAYVQTCYFIYLIQLFTWLIFIFYLPIHPSFYLSISIYRSIHPSIYFSIHPLYLPVHPSIHLRQPSIFHGINFASYVWK